VQKRPGQIVPPSHSQPTHSIVCVPAILEPTGLIRGDGKKPCGATLILSGGPPMLWDFTCTDTFAPSHLRKTNFLAGGGCVCAEAIKMAKYSALLNTHQFLPVAIETGGG